MSVRVLSWALREAPVQAKGDLLVLIVLADHAHDDGDGAYPSVGTIASMARLSRRGAQDALRSLEAAGLIVAARKPGKTTVYRIVMGGAATAPAQPLRSAARRAGGRNQQPKGAQPLRPNRKEPSSNRGDLSDYDAGVIES